MFFGLCVTFALIAAVLLIAAISIIIDAEILSIYNNDIDSVSYLNKKKKALIFAFITCLSIGISVTTGKINNNRDKVIKMHIDDIEFQNKLISSYKEKYGLDKNIIDYSEYI